MSYDLKNILLVENQNSIALEMQNYLKKSGFTNVFIANNVAEASDFILTIKPDLILMDISLGGRISGIDIIKWMSLSYKIPFIYLSSDEDDETLQKAAETNPVAIVKKALYLTELEEAILKVFK
ncbi:MAG TPA: response regulator [Ignavibacteriaceae bacterium]|nr:response regulator [Ignavibacteriaceae bacterium]